MNEKIKLRIFGDGSKKKDMSLCNKDELKLEKIYPQIIKSNVKYIKKDNVDYDVLISIPSHNRYQKILRLLNQFTNQNTKYTFKFFVLNDGSSDNRYDTLNEIFPNLTYIKNEIPNGKGKHWYCYSQLWNEMRNISSHTILQMDDDFILCDKFLDKIIDLFFEEKLNSSAMMAIAPHLWSFKENVEQEIEKLLGKKVDCHTMDIEISC